MLVLQERGYRNVSRDPEFCTAPQIVEPPATNKMSIHFFVAISELHVITRRERILGPCLTRYRGTNPSSDEITVIRIPRSISCVVVVESGREVVGQSTILHALDPQF